MRERRKHCRWCGNAYIALKPPDRDGFCKSSCKQAHYRAYKKYVTAKASNVDIAGPSKVTRKTRASQSARLPRGSSVGQASQGKKRKKKGHK